MQQMQFVNLAYLLAVCCFVVGLKRLSSPKTARGGNLLASLAMLIAIVATLLRSDVMSFEMIVAGMIIGTAIGAWFSITVQMTGMPEMVALFNGFGGLASVFVAISEYAGKRPGEGLDAAAQQATSAEGLTLMALITIGLSVLIGAVTFSGSIVAWGKLNGRVPSQPLTFPFQNVSNALLFLIVVALFIPIASSPENVWAMILLLVLALALGVLLVIPIGGADMPVVISLLNSYSGVAACATGFVLQNELLIIAGSLVGAAGIILTVLMCKAMNRSLTNVAFGAFGVADSTGGGGPKGGPRSVREYSIEDAAMTLEAASSVIIIPGYGLAVARAQHITRELGQVLEANGVSVKYAIHPVAGRMPGHMNVLLAEADVPYEQLVEMDAINPEFETTDVALVLGANDVINPAARSDKSSPIYGMPILDVDKARTVMICKRSLGTGFAGIDNELFFDDKTMMLFGDAKATVTSLVEALRNSH